MKNYHAALIIAGINIVVFILQVMIAGFTEEFVLVSSDLLVRPWLLLTSMFLHGSLFHLFSNMFALFVFGIVLEHYIGSRRFVALYVVSGIFAGVVASFFYDSALGASGAIFGVLGYLAVIKPRMVVWTYGVPMPMIVAAGFWLLLDIIGFFNPSSIANMAHVAGLIFGAALAWPNREKVQHSRRRSSISDNEFERWEDLWMR